MTAILIAVIVGALVGLITGVFQWAIAELTGIVLPSFSLDLMSIPGIDWTIVNAIIPLSEAVVMFYALLTMYSLINVIRWVKSFLPTVSN